MDVEIRVDRGRCIGSGQCVNVAPGVFDQDAQAKAFVHDQHGEPEERIVHAVTACPMAAISLHVGTARIGPEDLNNWDRGARLDDPLVETLIHLSDQHHELREAFAAVAERPDPGSDRRAVAELVDRARVHLADESAAYGSIVALVDPAMVGVFEDSHRDIADALDAPHGEVIAAQWFREFRQSVEEHIRLEETMLFPVALGALWREHAAVAH